jgi:hypothetical protein
MIVVNFVGVGNESADRIYVRLGDAGGIETSGYRGTYERIDDSGTTRVYSDARINVSYSGGGGDQWSGSLTLSLESSSSNTWCWAGNWTDWNDDSNITQMISAGHKPLSAELDRLELHSEGGANQFDTGAVNIMYI